MSRQVPKVAVLLTAYNGIAFIEPQLHSIVHQEDVNVVIYISVDFSTDGTYEWCLDYAKQHSNICILSYGERYGGAALNFYRLIREVDFKAFDYVALSDQDDIWLPDKLITACNAITKNDVDAYSSNVLAFWPNGQQKLTDKAHPQREYDYLLEAAGPGCTYVMKVSPMLRFKALLNSNWQLSKQVILHDWFIYAFFRVNHYKWVIDPNFKMHYRQHEHNQVGINKGFKAGYRRFKLLKNGWYKQQITLILELLELNIPIFNSRWQILKNVNVLRRHWKDRTILFFVVLVGLLD